jgi:putative flippase GtrA
MSNFLGVHYVIATIIGYILGIINSYFWNKFWTFKKNKKSLNEFLKFVLVYLFAFTVNVGSIVFLKESLYVSPNIGEIVGILFAMIVSYAGQRFWTFK